MLGSNPALDMAMALDPVIMSRKLGIEPDPWQAQLLRSQDRQVILNITRQGGKSQTTSFVALHHALFKPKALVLIFSPTQRQSVELFLKIRTGYRDLTGSAGCWYQERQTGNVLELKNGSRIVALPGKDANIRGFSGVTLLIIDEASRVADGLYHALRPMLAVSKGRIMLLSTFWGKRGFFWETWEKEVNNWLRFRVTAADCPRITSDFLEEERRNMPIAIYMQEYFCEACETEDQVFSYNDIQSMFDTIAKPLFGDEVRNYDGTY